MSHSQASVTSRRQPERRTEARVVAERPVDAIVIALRQREVVDLRQTIVYRLEIRLVQGWRGLRLVDGREDFSDR